MGGSPNSIRVTRLLLVDDHVAVREALALAFEREDDFAVVGQASTCAQARRCFDEVDVAVIDLRLPDGDGSDLIPLLRRSRPGARAIALTAADDRASIARAVERGAAAVLSKSTALTAVVDAVRRLRAGETLLPQTELLALVREAGAQRERERAHREALAQLTPRELEVLAALAAGLNSREIAERLVISQRTQRNHVSNILGKLDVHSQLQAVVLGLRYGAVDLGVFTAPSAEDEQFDL